MAPGISSDLLMVLCEFEGIMVGNGTVWMRIVVICKPYLQSFNLFASLFSKKAKESF